MADSLQLVRFPLRGRTGERPEERSDRLVEVKSRGATVASVRVQYPEPTSRGWGGGRRLIRSACLMGQTDMSDRFFLLGRNYEAEKRTPSNAQASGGAQAGLLHVLRPKQQHARAHRDSSCPSCARADPGNWLGCVRPARIVSIGLSTMSGSHLLSRCWHVGTIALFLILGSCSLIRPFASDTKISKNPVAIGPQWSTLDGFKVRATRTYQGILLELPADADWGTAWDIRLADSRAAIPEVELIDDRGNVFAMSQPFNLGGSGRYRGFSADRPLPRDRAYTAVRIRSGVPFSTPSVQWRCWDPK